MRSLSAAFLFALLCLPLQAGSGSGTDRFFFELWAKEHPKTVHDWLFDLVIGLVKRQPVPGPYKTMGEALESYYNHPQWDVMGDDGNVLIVTFTDEVSPDLLKQHPELWYDTWVLDVHRQTMDVSIYAIARRYGDGRQDSMVTVEQVRRVADKVFGLTSR